MALMFACSISMVANAQVRVDQKYIEAIGASSEISPLSQDSFGDNVSLANGGTRFAWTDINVPGNNELPVRLQRSLFVEDKTRSGRADLGGFGAAGSVDVPYLMGIFSTSGWQVYGSNPNARCSSFNSPPDLGHFVAADYWNGNWLHIPGGGDQLLLKNPAPQLPLTTSSAPILTKEMWAFRCLASTKNGYAGEGFLAISPQGVKYYFDWAVTKSYPSISKRYGNYAHATANMSRSMVYLLASRIEDRFGNWVTYEYQGSSLKRIQASDGRYISVDSWNGSNIASVSSSVGNWTYQYGTNSMTATLPDGSQWKFASTGMLIVEPMQALPLYDGALGPDGLPRCPAPEPSQGEYGASVTLPSGATATYSFYIRRHGKSNVPKLCNSFIDNGLFTYRYLTIPNFSDTFTLREKVISGPGLAPMRWTYSYLGAGGGLAFADMCANPPTPQACPRTNQTEVRGPDRAYRRYTFGRMFGVDSGQLFKAEEGFETGDESNPQVVIQRTTETEYLSVGEVAALQLPDKFGSAGSSRFDDVGTALNRPIKTIRITQDGRVFSTTNTTFDIWGRPTTVIKSSVPAP